MRRKKATQTWLDATFVLGYEFPPGMLDRALQRCPAGTSPEDVEDGLRQFLIVAGRQLQLGATAAMPSSVVDEAWHEFLVYTRSYAAFCERAYGCFLHHDPEVAMSARDAGRNSTVALAASWVAACELEHRDPWTTNEAPVLFAADVRAGVPAAPVYVGNCGSPDPCQATEGTVCMTHQYLGSPARYMPDESKYRPKEKSRSSFWAGAPAAASCAAGGNIGGDGGGHSGGHGSSCGSSSGCGGGGCGGGS